MKLFRFQLNGNWLEIVSLKLVSLDVREKRLRYKVIILYKFSVMFQNNSELL